MYLHNNFSCKSVICLSPAVRLRSYLNEVQVALILLGKEVTFLHCGTSIKSYILEVGPSASSTRLRLSKVKPVTRLQISPPL